MTAATRPIRERSLLAIARLAQFTSRFLLLSVALLCYGATCAALPALRRRADAPEALLRVPGGSVIAVAALVLIIWLLSHSTWAQARVSALAAVAGVLIFAWSRRYRSA